jgi:hypothetical protein
MPDLSDADTLLLAARAVFLVFSFILAAITFTAWRRATRRQSEQLLASCEAILQRLTALEARAEAGASAIAQVDERLERQSQMSSAPAPGYQIAIRLARGGATREELMSSCGLSLGEAELVQRLHGAVHGSAREAANAA